MRFVGLMAVREMRSSWKRLLFFFICIAIGVGAIVALRSVIQSVRNTFAGEARSLIAADAIINSNQPLKPEVIAKIDERLKAAGAQSIRSVELATMARAADRAGRPRPDGRVARGRGRLPVLRQHEAGGRRGLRSRAAEEFRRAGAPGTAGATGARRRRRR